MSISKILYQTLCVFSQIKDRNYIEQSHALGWDLGVLGESKTLARGFAMASHLLRALVFFYILEDFCVWPL